MLLVPCVWTVAQLSEKMSWEDTGGLPKRTRGNKNMPKTARKTTKFSKISVHPSLLVEDTKEKKICERFNSFSKGNNQKKR